MKFTCNSCGDCCSNFGDLGTLPLFNDEKKRLEELGKNLNISTEFIPENVMMDDITGAIFCGNWGMKGNPCPFLDKNNKCLIYKNRPLICKAFPIYKIVKSEKDLNLGCFINCKNFDFDKFKILKKPFNAFFGNSSVNARKTIDWKQKVFSEKIFSLVALGKIKLVKVDNPYLPDVISIEDFFEVFEA